MKQLRGKVVSAHFCHRRADAGGAGGALRGGAGVLRLQAMVSYGSWTCLRPQVQRETKGSSWSTLVRVLRAPFLSWFHTCADQLGLECNMLSLSKLELQEFVQFVFAWPLRK